MAKKEIIVVGPHSANVAFQYHPLNIISVFIDKQSSHQAAWCAKCAEVGITPMLSKKSTLDTLSSDVSHQGIILKLKMDAFSESDLLSLISKLESPPLILILDGIHDPHNLGACLRSAEAFGATAVVTPSHDSVGLTPAVSKAACGAEQLIPLITVKNITRFIESIQKLNIWVAGLSADASKTLNQLDATGPLALVMGQEGRGIRPLTEKKCDWLARIPMQGCTASLNLSASASISLYEVSRQRGN